MELVSKDPVRTQEFFQRVFGWKMLEMPGGYTIFEAPQAPHGGIRRPEKGERPGTLPHLEVASVDATLKAIVAAGGKVVKKRTEIPNGCWAVFEDPGGVVQAILETRDED